MQALFDIQLASIKHYSVASFSEDTKMHFITYRYAQLTASLLQLNTDYQVSILCQTWLCQKPVPRRTPLWLSSSPGAGRAQYQQMAHNSSTCRAASCCHAGGSAWNTSRHNRITSNKSMPC